MLAYKNAISKKFVTHNIQEIWDTMKRSKLAIIGIEEGKKLKICPAYKKCRGKQEAQRIP